MSSNESGDAEKPFADPIWSARNLFQYLKLVKSEWFFSIKSVIWQIFWFAKVFLMMVLYYRYMGMKFSTDISMKTSELKTEIIFWYVLLYSMDWSDMVKYRAAIWLF